MQKYTESLSSSGDLNKCLHHLKCTIYCSLHFSFIDNFVELVSFSKIRGVEALIKQLSVPLENSEPLKFTTTYSQGAFSQFRICLWKQNLVYWRSPTYNAVRLFFTTLSALILGSIFWDVGSKR